MLVKKCRKLAISPVLLYLPPPSTVLSTPIPIITPKNIPNNRLLSKRPNINPKDTPIANPRPVITLAGLFGSGFVDDTFFNLVTSNPA